MDFRMFLSKGQYSTLTDKDWIGNIDNVKISKERLLLQQIDSVGSLVAGVWRAHQCLCCHFFAGDY